MRPDPAPARGSGETASALVVLPPGAPDLRAVVGVIERLGLQVEIHHAAGSALDRIEYGPPRLVVHGCELPDMDAATFHRAVERRGGRRIATLAILPPGRTPEDRLGEHADQMETIARPFETEELAARLTDLLHRADAIEAMASPPRSDEPRARTAGNGDGRSRGADLRIRVVGLGAWGTRGAELFAARGMTARAVDTEAGIGRANLAESRRHRVRVPGRAPGDLAAAARALACDEELGRALAAEADCDLFVVVADLAAGAGALLASLLLRIEELAPGVGRLAVARLPGLRSGPDERALGLVALNSVLQTHDASVFLVQPADDLGIRADAESHAALLGLLDLFSVVSGGGGDPVLPISRSELMRFLATPGFVGWRELELTMDACAAQAPAWHERLAAGPPRWQPEGFAWSEAQAVLPLARAPYGWIDDGGRVQFDRLVQAAWDEAAPCVIHPALSIGEPALAVLVSTGLPYPSGILKLRDSVEGDRARLAEKRRAAEALIPLSDDFLPGGAQLAAEPAGAEPEEEEAALEEPLLEEPVAEPAPAAPEAPEEPAAASFELAPEPPELVPEPPELVPEPPELVPEPPAFAEEPPERAEEPIELVPEPPELVPEPPELVLEPPELAEEPVAPADELPEPAPEPAGLADEPVEAPEEPAIPAGYEPTPVPAAYGEALALAGRILASEDLGAEVDLGEIRYVLYDLLEVVREEPTSILREVFRPASHDYFERHHVNVAVLSILAGDLLKGSLSDVIDLGTAALLHDIGMTETRTLWDVDLRLPPKLFDRAVRQHPGAGYRKLQAITGMTGDIARMVLEEHERMDGTGYPEGIVGEAIDPGARILAVCDTLEALTHPRPFRENLTPSEALSRLQILGQYTLDGTIVATLTNALGELLATSNVATGAD